MIPREGLSWLRTEATEGSGAAPSTTLRLLDEIERQDQEHDRLRAALADLSYRVGRYIECDERPRMPELWSQMCEAQAAAATYLNERP